MTTEAELNAFENNIVNDIAGGIKRPAEVHEPPTKIIKKPRIGRFDSIAIVEESDIVDENLANIITLFKHDEWKVKAGEHIFQLTLDCIRRAIAARHLIGGFAMSMMFMDNPLMAALTTDEQYVLFDSVLDSNAFIFAVVENSTLYYDLMNEFCMLEKPGKSTTLHMKKKNLFGNHTQVKVYFCNLISSRGCQFTPKDAKGGKDIGKMALELRLNNPAIKFLHAWNWIARDLLIDSFYFAEQALIEAYLASLTVRVPSRYKRRFFTHFTFEEIWAAYCTRVIKYLGKQNNPLLDDTLQYAANSTSEIDMWRDANFRTPRFMPIPVQDGALPRPAKTYLNIPLIELPELPEMSDNPTPAEIAADKAARFQIKTDIEIMKCFLRADFWDDIPVNEAGYYDAKYSHEFSKAFVNIDPDAPVTVLRHIAEIPPDEFIRSPKITDEIKKAAFDKYHAVETKTTVPDKFDKSKTRTMVTVQFDATKPSEKKENSYESGFLAENVFTLVLSPGIGQVNNAFNNKPFVNKVYWVDVMPEKAKTSSKEEALCNVLF